MTAAGTVSSSGTHITDKVVKMGCEPVLCDKCGKQASLIRVKNTDDEAWVCHPCKHFISYKPEIWSRTVGYVRPLRQWNKGKQQEYCDRTPFKIEVEGL